MRPGSARILRRIGQFQANVLLTAVYLILWLPVGLVAQLLADWLHWKSPQRTHWWRRAGRLNRPEHLREPF